ncbi:MAG TPA: DUF433 domain-containing protein [Tepidisphaeraceae bacterium]|nr:DUF433 domain-containing protein [Tepidisphaeraceae bacterium]
MQHIILDQKGRPCLQGSRFKVIELVSIMLGQGWNAEQTREQYPHLSLGQIYTALAYYYDHKMEMDAEMERLAKETEFLRTESADPTFRDRLLARGKSR